MKPRRLAQVFLCVLALSTVPPGAQTSLSADEARFLAADLVRQGQSKAALDVLSVLLVRDTRDANALIISAQAHRRLRDFPAAQASARSAWKHAETPNQHYGAAMAMAQALSQDNKKTRAQLWLRRAAEIAPTPELEEKAISDYRFVRVTNPWSVRLSFGLSPSDNVNNAPRDNTYVIGPLTLTDPTAVPLEGVEINAGLRLRYNYDTETTRRNYVAFRWSETQVILTDDTVPTGVSDSDFNYRRLAFAHGWDRMSGPKAPRRNTEIEVASTWYGGNQLSTDLTLAYQQQRRLQSGDGFHWSTSLTYTDRQDSDLRSGFIARLGATYSLGLDTGRLDLIGRIDRTETDSAAATHTRVNVGLAYTLGREIMGAQVDFSAMGEFKRYDDPLYIADPRSDNGITLSSSLFFKGIDSHGFAPKVTLSARRVNSNVGRFEIENIGLDVGFQSTF